MPLRSVQKVTAVLFYWVLVLYRIIFRPNLASLAEVVVQVGIVVSFLAFYLWDHGSNPTADTV